MGRKAKENKQEKIIYSDAVKEALGGKLYEGETPYVAGVLAEKLLNVYCRKRFKTAKDIFDFFVITQWFDVDMIALRHEVERIGSIEWEASPLRQDILSEYKVLYNALGLKYVVKTKGHPSVMLTFEAAMCRLANFVAFIQEDCVWVHNMRVMRLPDNAAVEEKRIWSKNQLRFFDANKNVGTLLVGDRALTYAGLMYNVNDVQAYTPHLNLNGIRLGDIRLDIYHFDGFEYCLQVDTIYNIWVTNAERALIEMMMYSSVTDCGNKLIEAMQNYFETHDDMAELYTVAEHYKLDGKILNYWLNISNTWLTSVGIADLSEIYPSI